MGGLIDTKGLADLVMQGINRIWPDKTEQEKQQAANDLAVMLAQAGVNKAEASTGNLFIAGWRPAVGWTCCLGLAYQFVIGPILSGVFTLAVEPIDTASLIQLLVAMLGLGAYRTFEKHTNTERNR